MTDEERLAVVITRLRLAGVHPSWIEYALLFDRKGVSMAVSRLEAWEGLFEAGHAVGLRKPCTHIPLRRTTD